MTKHIKLCNDETPMQEGAEDILRIKDDMLANASVRDRAPLQENETPRAWSFKDDAVAKKFDAHVREQLPWYDALSRYVADIAVSFLPTSGVLYDIGASTGNITKLLRDDLDAKGALAHSIEPSHEMAAHWAGKGDLFVIDAERIDYAGRGRPDVAVLFLTLMFMKPAERESFLRKLFGAVNPGGAVIIVDKGYIQMSAAQVACKAAQLAGKLRDGTPGDAYVRKEISLRGEQRPTDTAAVMQLAWDCKFEVEEIFRFGEFYGLLCVKHGL